MKVADLQLSRWLLAAIASLSPFGVSIMVPLLPLLSTTLDRPVSELQFLVSIYVIGLAVSQPIVGIVSDIVGRRPVLIWGFTVFVVASMVLIFIDSLAGLIWWRFCQALGVGVGTVVARGIIRDHLPPNEALKAFALLTAAMGFTPVVAPMAGGFIASIWRVEAVFALLAVVGGLLLLWCVRAIPDMPTPEAGSPLDTHIKGYSALLRSSVFWGNACAFGFLQGMFFCLLATGGLMFETYFGIGMQAFGVLWGSLALIYILGSFLLSHISALGTPCWQHRAARAMLLVSLLAPALMATLGLTLTAVLLPLSCSMLLSGLLTPATMFGAVNAIPKWSGSAAGLSSSVGMSMAGGFSFIAGKAYEVAPESVMVCFGVAGCGFVLCWWLAHRAPPEHVA